MPSLFKSQSPCLQPDNNPPKDSATKDCEHSYFAMLNCPSLLFKENLQCKREKIATVAEPNTTALVNKS